MESLKCILCHKPKLLSELSKDSSDKRGHKGMCKVCAAAKQAKYRASWSTKKHKAVNAAMLLSRRKSLYGEEGIKHFDAQRKLQKNKCAICKRKLAKACSDHNHKTKQHRGVLCDCCNRGLGLLQDSTKILKAAIQYLKYWETQWNKKNT
jgi:hypothetical protein